MERERKETCDGSHRYFFTELIVEENHDIKVPIVCTACGHLIVHNIPGKLNKA